MFTFREYASIAQLVRALALQARGFVGSNPTGGTEKGMQKMHPSFFSRAY